ncbi:hypothetical protein [Methylobacterium sp. NFXW15]|uniref:hypothetical protein n=1 Tax=Methylobacterium sp. NFXW15 TaxID=2819512 RepID=UPI003CF11849
MRGPDRNSVALPCRSQDRPALADGGGRMTMPFVPTLFTIAFLAAASVYCTKGDAPAPAPTARMIPASGGASLAMTAPVSPTSEPPARPPAVIAFSEIYPLVADPVTTSALPAHSANAAVVAPRPPRKVATTSSIRRACPGRRCTEGTVQDHAPAEDPFQPARTASEEASPTRIPSALPFAESVVEAVVPVAREVGSRVEQISGGAGDLLRGSQAVVKGSIGVLGDRLF